VPYTFDPLSGDTRAALAARTTFNSFSETRYSEFVKRALNDAVTEVCRKLQVAEAYEVLTYDAAGVVADTALPWFRVHEVWAAAATAPAAGEVAFRQAASYQLDPLPTEVLGDLGGAGGALFYIARRRRAPTGFGPQLDLRVVPAGAGGFVAVCGLQRPAVMDDDADISGLGADLDRALVAYAKAECFDNEDDFQAAAQWRQRFRDELYTAAGDVGDDGPETVPGTWAD
jgi:hypothetical protein